MNAFQKECVFSGKGKGQGGQKIPGGGGGAEKKGGGSGLGERGTEGENIRRGKVGGNPLPQRKKKGRFSCSKKKTGEGGRLCQRKKKRTPVRENIHAYERKRGRGGRELVGVVKQHIRHACSKKRESLPRQKGKEQGGKTYQS